MLGAVGDQIYGTNLLVVVVQGLLLRLVELAVQVEHPPLRDSGAQIRQHVLREFVKLREQLLRQRVAPAKSPLAVNRDDALRQAIHHKVAGKLPCVQQVIAENGDIHEHRGDRVAEHGYVKLPTNPEYPEKNKKRVHEHGRAYIFEPHALQAADNMPPLAQEQHEHADKVGERHKVEQVAPDAVAQNEVREQALLGKAVHVEPEGMVLPGEDDEIRHEMKEDEGREQAHQFLVLAENQHKAEQGIGNPYASQGRKLIRDERKLLVAGKHEGEVAHRGLKRDHRIKEQATMQRILLILQDIHTLKEQPCYGNVLDCNQHTVHSGSSSYPCSTFRPHGYHRGGAHPWDRAEC